MEATALKHAGPVGLPGHSPLLRLQSDERLVALARRGNQGAFEALVSRYQSRLLAFCRHMLGSREDAEDVLQEVFAASFNAMLADERPINVRPWLYRIARNRCLNHLRRPQAIGVDSMDIHLSENGLTTADTVHKREEFRQLVADVQELPESQRTALLLREIDALSYDQIAEAMETTVPSVKSLLVRARVSLAEAAEARRLTCEEVRYELGEVAEGLKRLSPPVRRHMRSCDRCTVFRAELRKTNKALALTFPVAPLLAFKKLILAHLGTTAAAGGGATAAGTAAATSAGTAAAGSAAGGLLSAGASAVATKAVATAAAAAIVTAGVAEVKHHRTTRVAQPAAVAAVIATPAAAAAPVAQPTHERAAVTPVEKPRVAEKPVKDDAAATDPAASAAPPAVDPAATQTPVPAPPAVPDKTQQVEGTITLPGSTDSDATTPPVVTAPPQPQEPQPSEDPDGTSPPVTQEQPAPPQEQSPQGTTPAAPPQEQSPQGTAPAAPPQEQSPQGTTPAAPPAHQEPATPPAETVPPTVTLPTP